DAFATTVGQRGRTGAPEERRQPSRQVAAHHVAVARIARPARDELSEYRRSVLEAALQRILEIEQAEIIFAALAHDDLFAAFGRIGKEPARLLVELTLERLGIGGDPYRPAGL